MLLEKKYNKDIQNRLNINQNTYKENFKIELEIIPNKEEKYGKFININDDFKHYFDIYFNGNKVEIKILYWK